MGNLRSIGARREWLWHQRKDGESLFRYARRLVKHVREMTPRARKYGLRYYYDSSFRSKHKRRERILYRGRAAVHKPRQIKNFLAKRDGQFCRMCFQTIPIPQLTADHVIELADGGSKGRENMQLLCVPCHKLKTDRSQALRVGG